MVLPSNGCVGWLAKRLLELVICQWCSRSVVPPAISIERCTSVSRSVGGQVRPVSWINRLSPSEESLVSRSARPEVASDVELPRFPLRVFSIPPHVLASSLFLFPGRAEFIQISIARVLRVCANFLSKISDGSARFLFSRREHGWRQFYATSASRYDSRLTF